MIIYVDIDGTICTLTDGEYSTAAPLFDRISKINKLFDSGEKIIFQTARGMGRTSNNTMKAIDMFEELTKNQLDKWGVKYHHLFLGKPAGDLYIDDKGCKDVDFF